jgi:hypothetical protein
MNILQLADEPTFTPFVMSCRLPRNPMFRAYVAHADGRLDTHEVSEAHAKNYLHNVCQIESRNDLKQGGEPVRRFNHMLRHFKRWSDQQQENHRREA